MIKNTRMIRFKEHTGLQGNLIAIESGADIPFEIKRVYYITGVPGNITRGYHSHRKLEQILLCLNGSVKIRVKTPVEEEIIQLNRPDLGLMIGHMVWREMFAFSPGCVLLVLASEYYTESDYIRSYKEYELEAENYFSKGESLK